MTRERAVERVGKLRSGEIEYGHTRWCSSECEHLRLADLLLAVQTETEARVVAKCCDMRAALEVTLKELQTVQAAAALGGLPARAWAGFGGAAKKALKAERIRAAFPAQEDGR
jgi:hypothetical protein